MLNNTPNAHMTIERFPKECELSIEPNPSTFRLQGKKRPIRVDAIDCLRGAMLTVVLADHIDALTPTAFIASWTLLGLGFSDASDVFVFLSGFVFGFVYGERISNSGVFGWHRIAARTITVYCYFLASTFVLGVLNVCAGDWSWWAQGVFWLRSICMIWHDLNTAILCLFVVLIPWAYVLQKAIGQRNPVSMLYVSFAAYFVSQFTGASLPRGWLFQPLSWQFLMIIASILGQRYRSSASAFIPRSKWLAAFSITFLLFSLVIRKTEVSWHLVGFDDLEPLASRLVSKPSWGPLRAIHHLSLMYLLIYLLPFENCIWSSRLLLPLRICGKNPLLLYCTGVVTTKIGLVLLQCLGSSDLMKLVLLFDAILLQFMVAHFLSFSSATHSPPPG